MSGFKRTESYCSLLESLCWNMLFKCNNNYTVIKLIADGDIS